MRKLGIALGALLVVVALFFGLVFGASESGEVVVLRTSDDAGAVRETRLWVVEDQGAEWLRAGNPEVGWFVRLRARPEVEVERAGLARRVRAVPVPEARDRINDLMQAKYGWADSVVCLLASREIKIPVRLDRL
jgi:hypothetical protein